MIELNNSLGSIQMEKQTFNQTKKILGILIVVFFVAAIAAPTISAYKPHTSYSSTGNYEPTLFRTEHAAQHHCPYDTVVWLNLRSGIYHYKGHHWYGNTKSGAYVCEQEADTAGDRAAYNEHQYGRHPHHNHRSWHRYPRAHYYHGLYYPNCDWVWSPAKQNWVWEC